MLLLRRENVMQEKLRKWWRTVGWAFCLSGCLLGIELVFAISASWCAPFAVLPLAGIWAWASTRQAHRLAARAEAGAHKRLTMWDAGWKGHVAQCLPVLPVLSQQLDETAKQVEQAVVQVCESFSDIAARAQESVVQSERSLGVKDARERGASLQSLIETTRKTLQDVLDRLMQTGAFSRKMVCKMEDIEEGIKEIGGTLQEIEAIARRTKLLALNTTIEAARIGEHGKGFAVVASEVTKLAERSARTSATIRTIIRRVNDLVRTASQELGMAASADMNQTMLCREEVEQTMGVLGAASETMCASVLDAVQNSNALAQDIAQAVITLQFQDMVNQRVAHVIEALGEMDTLLSSLLHDDARTREKAAIEDWATRLERLYTMAAERKVLAAHTGNAAREETANQAGGADGLGDNVELF